MAEPRVIFDGVWKKFRRGERHDSLRDLIPATARKLFGRNRDDELEEQEFWALKDVSFEVKPGEAVGIIGANGAGKSTALKLLTRILKPTRGHCRFKGRLGALIEVAAGFHGDLTGVENIYLQAAIMGLSRSDIRARLDSIIDFAGVGEFLNTPVKRYSSGMQARLGFAVAAHLEPDVLLVDEVLSVGDFNFQSKCLNKMKRVVADGTAIVFVSHQMPTVLALCRRAILLQKGNVVSDGDAAQAIAAYTSAGGRWDFPLVDEPRVRAQVEVVPALGNGLVPQGQVVTVRQVLEAFGEVQCSPGVFLRREGADVLSASVTKYRGSLLRLEKGQRALCQWSFRLNVQAGSYDLGWFVENGEGGRYHGYVPQVASFVVVPDERVEAECFVDMGLTCEIHK